MHIDIENWKSNGKYIRFENNNIFYLQKGIGENVLIIHGYPGSSFEWRKTVIELAKYFKVTVFDLLGMGFSDKPQDIKYSYSKYCDIINALLSHLKIANTHVLCHDLGVNIAQELIASEREKKYSFDINSVAFVNGSIFIDVFHPLLIQKIVSKTPTFFNKLWSKNISRRSHDNFTQSIFGVFTKPSTEFLDKRWEILRFKQGKACMYLIEKLISEKYHYHNRWIFAMQNTTVPLCYICGPFDPTSGIQMAKRYAKLMPTSSIFLLEKNIGHWPQIEDAYNFNRIYKEFVEHNIKTNNNIKD